MPVQISTPLFSTMTHPHVHSAVFVVVAGGSVVVVVGGSVVVVVGGFVGAGVGSTFGTVGVTG